MLRPREQSQDGCGDDPESALAADEELLPVVSGIVLAQPAQTIGDSAVGQDHFKTQDEIAGHAIAQDVHPTRIGGDHTADGGRALGRDADGQQTPGRGSRVLSNLQDASGLGLDGHADGIDVADRRHAVEGQDNLRAGTVRNGAACQSGVAALGHDCNAGLMADLHDLRHLLGRGRPDDAGGLAGKELAPIHRIGLLVGTVGHDSGGS